MKFKKAVVTRSFLSKKFNRSLDIVVSFFRPPRRQEVRPWQREAVEAAAAEEVRAAEAAEEARVAAAAEAARS
jgi:hypothetical protein